MDYEEDISTAKDKGRESEPSSDALRITNRSRCGTLGHNRGRRGYSTFDIERHASQKKWAVSQLSRNQDKKR